jgi:enoyl-CoA hydratase/carnithine racemase
MTEDTRLDPPSLEIAGSRATIRLHRSRHRNRIEPGDIIRIMDYLEQVDANPSLRVLVLAATGPAFSAGFHLGGFAEDKEAAARAPSFEAMVDRFEAVRVPTICRLQGGVYGGSTDFALTPPGLACITTRQAFPVMFPALG